tara:strand:- start:41 stop:403 length:363 start_codon:yes stop_codon:yes gene_type:complete
LLFLLLSSEKGEEIMIIARTRSGVGISFGSLDSESFLSWTLTLPFEDQFDIYCVSQWSYSRERQKTNPDKKALRHWQEVIEGLGKAMPMQMVENEKSLLGLNSSTQLVDFGRHRSLHFWR